MRLSNSQTRSEYAWGVFNGTRNGFLDANDYKDTMGLVSFRPFIKNEGSRFQNLTIGGSYDYGIQDSQAPTSRRQAT
jgi:phosphate-selective porin OprO/OprP